MSQLDDHLADSEFDTLKEVDSTNDDSSSDVLSTKTRPVRNGKRRKKKTLGKQGIK